LIHFVASVDCKAITIVKQKFYFSCLASYFPFFGVFTCLIWNVEGKYWFRVEKNEICFIAVFHVLGLFIPKQHDLSEKKILSRAVAVVRLNLCNAYSQDHKT
jgi:hypothetical protein